ncbi:hypothetical protein ACMU_13515 [Actibacterium mucosum KCTC 23349]|uniref:Uncharacterized protein n=1 Tax=Actibacterium mucosum KCTC 23349 TaxID=1454373 RepID=A0A037ZGW6_9RHOB|nr:hypothetical protein [Actibacterium mucosum]KAJ55700.1 hypothetical protein ACMU_13515 [Actibacterium mucosum KCTC 23349]
MAGILMLLSLLAFSRVPPELNAFGMQLLPPRVAAREMQTDMNTENLPWSERGKSYLLKACLEASGQQSLALFPAAYRVNLAENCRNLATRFAERSPSYGLAKLVAAQSEGEIGDTAAFVQLMRESQERTRFEGWQAAWRVRTSVRYGAPEDVPGLAEVIAADFRVMNLSRDHRTLLAKDYRRFPEWREAISMAMLETPEDMQRRFLSAVRKQLKDGQ